MGCLTAFTLVFIIMDWLSAQLVVCRNYSIVQADTLSFYIKKLLYLIVYWSAHTAGTFLIKAELQQVSKLRSTCGIDQCDFLNAAGRLEPLWRGYCHHLHTSSSSQDRFEPQCYSISTISGNAGGYDMSAGLFMAAFAVGGCHF